MALQGGTSSDKAYRFISDPGHKENLSGRVRAACVTCRRKKIKCSGEVPCSTCEEKGIACEGLTERRRPKRRPDRRTRTQSAKDERRHSYDWSSGERTSRSERTSFDSIASCFDRDEERVQNPTLQHGESSSADSEDSGYASAFISTHKDATPSRLVTTFSVDYGLTAVTSSGRSNALDTSPSPYVNQDWSFAAFPEPISTFATGNVEPYASQEAHRMAEASYNRILTWPGSRRRSRDGIYGSDRGQAYTGALSGTQTFGAQTSSVRTLAPNPSQKLGDETRRQSVTSLIDSERLETALQHLTTPHDDISTVLGGRTLENGLTPMELDLNSSIDPWTTGFVQSTMNMPNTTTVSTEKWQYPSNFFDLAASNVQDELADESAHLGEYNTNRRQPAQMYQNVYGQLYPWPE